LPVIVFILRLRQLRDHRRTRHRIAIARLILRAAGLKEGKNVREKHASPDPDLFGDAEFCEMLANLSTAFSPARASEGKRN